MNFPSSTTPDQPLYPQADALADKAAERRRRQRGSVSRWVSILLGLVSLLVVISGALYMKSLGTKVVIGTKDEVRYSGTATKEQALALGQALKTAEYFSDKGVSVLLNKGDSGTIVSFVVKEGSWNDWTRVAAFEEMGRDVASSVGGYPLKVRLVDDGVAMKKEMDVHPNIKVGGIEVRYSGSATEAQAKALAEAFYKGVPDTELTLLFSVNQGKKEIAMVVHAGAWDDAGSVEGLQTFIRSVADSVGGLPITLRLIDSELNSKKEVPVQ